MLIARRPELETDLLDAMRRSFDASPREGLHLSDLLSPRQAYFKRVDPKPTTDDQIGYWVAGRGHEDAFGRVSGLERGQPAERFGIIYTKDFWQGRPVELKTRRRNLAEEGREADEYAHYLHQLRGYCALDDSLTGLLVVLSLVENQDDGSTKPRFAVYEATFTADELESARVDLCRRRDLLQDALAGAVPLTDVPLCAPWLCGKLARRMQTAPRCVTCDRDFATDWGLGKHQEAARRRGRGHDVREATYRYTYEARCPWYAACEPWRDDPARGGNR